MVKINLSQPMKNARDVQFEENYLDEKGKLKTRKVTLRDWLVLILNSRFDIIEAKENFWTTDLGIKFADTKNKEVEISDDKMKFLRRIIEANKLYTIGPRGDKQEIQPFTPFQIGLILRALGKSEKDVE